MAKNELIVKIDTTMEQLDEAIEKANQLVELLEKAKLLIDSLNGQGIKESYIPSRGSQVFRR